MLRLGCCRGRRRDWGPIREELLSDAMLKEGHALIPFTSRQTWDVLPWEACRDVDYQVQLRCPFVRRHTRMPLVRRRKTSS